MNPLHDFLNKIKPVQWGLVGVGIAFGAGAAFWGISDNIPAIVILMVGLASIAGAWVWNWPSPREYWMLFVTALVAFPVSVLLHNLFYALGTLVVGNRILGGLLQFLNVFFFLVSVIAVLPAAAVALIGGIYTSSKGMTRLTLVNRSCRRFVQKYRIKDKQLYRLLYLVRQSASGANLQPLKYILSNEEEKNELIFPTLSWAGYLKDWDGPEEGEKPSAYIILLGDTELAKSFQYDAGIASQSITLGAAEMGLGSCLIGSIKRDILRKSLAIADQYEILLVIALGKPAERAVIDEIGDDGDVKYWRDDKGIHHVPKRGLAETILDH